MKPAKRRLILLTGQSSYRSSRLSPEKEEFLRYVAPPGYEILFAGWPYRLDPASGPYVEPNLFAASMRNASQVTRTVLSQAFRQDLATSLNAVFQATTERLAIIAGSCGLELLNAGWQDPGGLRVCVVALGPACLRPMRLPRELLRTMRGRADQWSRIFYRGPIDCICECGHLDYYGDTFVRDQVRQWLRDAN